MSVLPLVLWPLGEVDRARRIAEEAVSQALQMGHVVPYILFAKSRLTSK